MVPPQLSVVPLYMMIAELRLGRTSCRRSSCPTLVSAFGVFFMRQYLIEALPDELIEAARVDGANSLRIVWHVVFPVGPAGDGGAGHADVRAGLERLLLAVHRARPDGNPTVQVALAGLGRGYIPDQSVIMAGALLGTLPLLHRLRVFGKQIVGGIMQGAVKG